MGGTGNSIGHVKGNDEERMEDNMNRNKNHYNTKSITIIYDCSIQLHKMR